MESLKFWKYQSVGNDFVILHEDCWNSLGKLGLDATRIIPLICDRKTGLGADGVLVVSQLNGEVHLKMFNADGTEDFCGNGIRCCARQAYDLGWVGEDFGITHFGRRVRCQVDKNSISTDLGFATYDHRLIPTNAEGELFLADLPMPTGCFGAPPTRCRQGDSGALAGCHSRACEHALYAVKQTKPLGLSAIPKLRSLSVGRTSVHE